MKVTETELGITTNEITIQPLNTNVDIDPIISSIPADYQLEKQIETEPQVSYQKYNDNIHLLEFKHTDDLILIVEFKDYLLVAGAPLNSANGELIIEKATEIVPDKPIRYFVFGHHHPHYIGGVRAFINNGTTILCYKDDIDYLNQIAGFSHSIKPDKLEISGKAPVIEQIENRMVISDEELELQIIHIGEMSSHTKDYLIFYFPQYKLLYEEDLIWIPNDKPLKAAGKRQKGVYDAIVKHGLEVEKIIQSWPVSSYNVKTMIDFAELKESVEMIED